MGKFENELRNFLFPLNFQWLQHEICQYWWHKKSHEAGFGT